MGKPRKEQKDHQKSNKKNKGKDKKKRQLDVPENVSNNQVDDADAFIEPADSRFDASKPQFRPVKEKTSKVVLDDRFASVLTDPRFQLDIQDKYGRPGKNKNKKQGGVQPELSAFYTLDDENQPSEKDRKNEKEKDDTEQAERDANDDEDSSSSSASSSSPSPANKDATSKPKNETPEDATSRISYLTALSRGLIDVSSSSEDEDSDDNNDNDNNSSSTEDDDDSKLDKDDDDDDDSEKPNDNEEQIEIIHEESPYLAVMNMDWTHVRAVDIFALVSSFTPPGAVRRVRVFPSDFGMKRLAEEEQFGPRGLWKEQETGTKKNSKGKKEKVADKGRRASADRDTEDDQDSHDGDSSPNESDDDDDDESDEDPADGDEDDRDDLLRSDFDPEKLRAYETSKLKYYFAVVEFSQAQYADQAYKEIDGMEFEHSSAAIDLRSIYPPEDLENVVIKDRPCRDEATSIPSNYVPPEFVVNALQQTNVKCTWEEGDKERERTLAKYSKGSGWEAMTEHDDIKAYLASDASSDEEEEEIKADQKASNIRKLLGLDSDGEEEEGNNKQQQSDSDDAHSSADEQDEPSSDEDSNQLVEEVDQAKEATFVPGGANQLQGKIRSKIEGKNDPSKEELTPWEKYQEKRRQKRAERRQAARSKKQEVKEVRDNPNTKAAKSREKKADKDAFFDEGDGDEEEETKPTTLSKAELELLVAGDDDDEQKRDYDMRDLERIEKNKDKKLRGSRKRKEADRVLNATGTDFKLNVEDDRFKAVLDGQDDRFGIDRTDPKFKETPVMRELLAEQARRRKSKRRKTSDHENPTAPKRSKDVDADVLVSKNQKPTGGAAALSALVKSLKSKVQ